MPTPLHRAFRGFALLSFSAPLFLTAAGLVSLSNPQLWQRAEWRIVDAPATANNFDPDLIRLDAVFTTPSQRVLTVPAFWFQDYTRALVAGVQVLTPLGAPEWRLRFTPDEPGEYALALTLTLPGQPAPPPVVTRFIVSPGAAVSPGGWIRTAADHRSLETSDGRPLRLIGANVCWGGPRATYSFDQWFPAMHAAGENFARLWFAPWSMGLEHKPGTLNRYDLAEAWQADYVLRLAGQNGINVLFAMDHHGMFMSNDPAWGGGNNYWLRSSPYSVGNGGPCASPDEFFTRDDARQLYQKRLRYLIGRYGWSPWLLSWQFFNEIDNAYLPRSNLVGAHVAAWHQAMGRWLHANDPYRHLVSTSLTGASDRPEISALPEMDFAVYHSYGEADPARYLATLTADFTRRYQKPVMIGEFGTDFRHWNLAADPYLRGFRQGLWGGVLGGSMGTSMSWWWESLHDDHVYPFYTALRDIMARAGWNEGNWTPATFAETGPAPLDLGEPVANGEPFNAQVPLNMLRLNPVAGEAALADPLAVSRAAERISSYLHGTMNPQLQQHARFTAWFTDRAQLVFRVDSVAADADLLVRIDGTEKLRVPLVNKDGLATLNDEVNQEFTVDLPAGKHRVEIAHTGGNWINLKSVRLERLLPAPFAGGWQFAPEAIGLRNENTAVVYVRSPHVAWPAGALRFNPPVVHGATVTLTNWTAGPGKITWLDPKTGFALVSRSENQGQTPGSQQGATGQTLTSTGQTLVLAVPDFAEDAVAIVTK